MSNGEVFLFYASILQYIFVCVLNSKRAEKNLELQKETVSIT